MEETLRFCKKIFEVDMNHKKEMSMYQYMSKNTDYDINNNKIIDSRINI
jgi:hypothetical protein